MRNFCIFLLLALTVPSMGTAQEIVRSSRYERANMSTKSEEKAAALREKYRLPAGCPVKAPSQGEEVIIIAYRHGMEVEESKIIQEEKVPFLFAERAMDACYFLFNREPVIIGRHAYLFETAGDAFSLYAVKDGTPSLVEVADGQAYMTKDGYLLKRWKGTKQ